MEQEEIDYEAAKELITYRITPDWEPLSNLVSEGEGQQSKNLKKQSELPAKVDQPREFKRLKKTYWAPEGSPPMRSKDKASQQSAQQAQLDQLVQPEVIEQQEGEEKEKQAPWVKKPFNEVVDGLVIARD